MTMPTINQLIYYEIISRYIEHTMSVCVKSVPNPLALFSTSQIGTTVIEFPPSCVWVESKQAREGYKVRAPISVITLEHTHS